MTAFEHALTTTYCKNPCQVLPNALWKTVAVIDKYKTAYSTEHGDVTFLKMWNDEQLLLYWTKNRAFTVSKEYLEKVTFMVIHQDYLKYVPRDAFSSQKSYFRLIHRDGIPVMRLPSGYCIADVAIDNEVEDISRLIAQCYTDLHPSIETVQSWTTHPGFDKKLWIWVTKENIPVGLGIAERDPVVPEGSLEWIQGLPAYRGMGIGRCIVVELLKRLQKTVSFTTVSGESDNQTKQFYESCGFYGEDIWWILRKE